MKQIYYVIQTLLRGRGSNIIKIISLGLSLTMSILLFSRVAYEQSFDTCYKDYDNLYQIWSVFTVKGEKYPPQEQNCGPVAGAIFENFPEQVEAATSTCHWMNAPLYNENARFDERKIVADSLFFKTMGSEVLSGNPVKDLQQPNVIFLSDRFAGRIFGGENPVGKTVNYNHEKDFIVKGTYAALPGNATVHPEAVISMGMIRFILRSVSILENNMVQTIGSAGESLAAGAIFTLPVLFLWAKDGIMDSPSLLTIMLISLCGGILGVLFMVPLRNALIVKEHGTLPYPEGTACAEVLLAGEEGGASAKSVFAGMGFAALFKFITDGIKVIPSVITAPIKSLKTELSAEV